MKLRELLISIAMILAGPIACATHVPEPIGVPSGTPHISWVIMSGDKDNADEDFVCESEPRTDCVVPASTQKDRVFSDVHLYYHPAAAETKYSGSIRIGYLGDTPNSAPWPADVTVKPHSAPVNHSVSGVVTSKPGSYSIAFEVVATPAGAQPVNIRDQITIVVK